MEDGKSYQWFKFSRSTKVEAIGFLIVFYVVYCLFTWRIYYGSLDAFEFIRIFKDSPKDQAQALLISFLYVLGVTAIPSLIYAACIEKNRKERFWRFFRNLSAVFIGLIIFLSL